MLSVSGYLALPAELQIKILSQLSIRELIFFLGSSKHIEDIGSSILKVLFKQHLITSQKKYLQNTKMPLFRTLYVIDKDFRFILKDALASEGSDIEHNLLILRNIQAPLNQRSFFKIPSFILRIFNFIQSQLIQFWIWFLIRYQLKNIKAVNWRVREVALKALAVLAPKLTEQQISVVLEPLSAKINDDESWVRIAALKVLAVLMPELTEHQILAIFIAIA